MSKLISWYFSYHLISEKEHLMDWALMSFVTFTQFLINLKRYHYSMMALTLISYSYCLDVFKSSIRRFLDILEWFYGYNYYKNIGCCYFYTNHNSLRWLLFDRNETYRQGLQSVKFFIRKNSFCVYSVSRPLRWHLWYDAFVQGTNS